LFEQGEQMEVEVSAEPIGGLTKEARDLYCNKIATSPEHVVVPSGLLRELTNRYVCKLDYL